MGTEERSQLLLCDVSASRIRVLLPIMRAAKGNSQVSEQLFDISEAGEQITRALSRLARGSQRLIEVQFTSAGCLNYPCRTSQPGCNRFSTVLNREQVRCDQPLRDAGVHIPTYAQNRPERLPEIVTNLVQGKLT